MSPVTQNWLTGMVVLAVWAALQWTKKLPTIQSVHQFTETLNTRGGNILILTMLMLFFFHKSIWLFTLLMDLSKPGVSGEPLIRQDNAFALMALQFVTASAFGGASAAMYKTMTSDSPPPPPETKPNGGK